MGLGTVDLGRLWRYMSWMDFSDDCVQLHSAAGSTQLNCSAIDLTSHYRSLSSSPYPSFPSFARGPMVSDAGQPTDSDKPELPWFSNMTLAFITHAKWPRYSSPHPPSASS